MANEQFSIRYNGQPVEVTCVATNEFLVQISYKPLRLKLQQGFNEEQWIDIETNAQTPLSIEIGDLIQQHTSAEVVKD